MDEESMYRMGRARQGGAPAPKGGGYGNGGRVAKAGYARGGMVDGEPKKGSTGGEKERTGTIQPIPYMAADGSRTNFRTGGGYKRGGRVKGC
jgi:hypothetical protein